jgi:hypothetical protein
MVVSFVFMFLEYAPVNGTCPSLCLLSHVFSHVYVDAVCLDEAEQERQQHGRARAAREASPPEGEEPAMGRSSWLPRSNIIASAHIALAVCSSKGPWRYRVFVFWEVASAAAPVVFLCFQAPADVLVLPY